MLRNIFLKSLYEKRWSLVAWSAAIVSMTAMTTLLFPTFREAFGQSLQDVPESVKAFLGDASAYQTLAGYVDIQVVAQMVFLTIIMAVILGSGFIAGDEGDGTLQSLLAQPVTRQKAYLQKYIALCTLTLIANGMVFVSVFVSGLFIGESMDWWRMAQATFGMWLITLVFGSAAFSLGAITGRRGISGSVVGMLAFVTYVVTSLAAGVKALRTVDTVSPFHYFNTPSILKYGLDWGNVAVLVVTIAAMSILGFVYFVRRDIGSQ